MRQSVLGNHSKFVGHSILFLGFSLAGAVNALTACSDDAPNGTGSASAGKSGSGSGSAGKSNGGSGGREFEEGGAGGVGGANDLPEGGAAGLADAGAGNSPGWDLRLSPNATPQTFDITTGGNDRFYGVTLDADDNIYAVGVTSAGFDANADYATVVAKFSPEGVLDRSFGDNGYAIVNVAVGLAGELARGIALQSDGKIIVSETVEHENAADPRDRDIAVLRFNTDGSKDADFGVEGVKIIDLSDGVLVGNAYLADSAWGLGVYPDDRIVVSGGLVAASKTDTDFALVRLTKDGEYDEGFGTKGVFTLDTLIGDPQVSNNASPRNLTILPDDQGIVAAGYQPVPGFDTKPVVYRVTNAGKLDETFGVDGVFSESILPEQTETYAAVPQSNGSLVTTGYGRELSSETTDIVSLRLKPNGTWDTSYGTDGLVRIDIAGFADNSRKLLVLPNDHIVLVGGGRPTAADVDGVVVALSADGQPDTSFGAKGFKTFDLGGPADFLWGVALAPSQTRVVAVGIKGATANTSNDDAALLILKLVR
ncbi:MAG TPA: delta-60 repeat domain-containing protein [Polyangiaceae bacterium]|nr:delta-60 repeat domain-containing protein [Polyangiaceae bacterium]